VWLEDTEAKEKYDTLIAKEKEEKNSEPSWNDGVRKNNAWLNWECGADVNKHKGVTWFCVPEHPFNVLCDVVVVIRRTEPQLAQGATPAANSTKGIALLIQCKEWTTDSLTDEYLEKIKKWRRQQSTHLPGPRWCGPKPTPNKDLEEFCDAHDIIHVFCTVNELKGNEKTKVEEELKKTIKDRDDGEAFMSMEGMRRWCPMVGHSGTTSATMFMRVHSDTATTTK
jgi:hypothetical protein